MSSIKYFLEEEGEKDGEDEHAESMRQKIKEFCGCYKGAGKGVRPKKHRNVFFLKKNDGEESECNSVSSLIEFEEIEIRIILCETHPNKEKLVSSKLMKSKRPTWPVPNLRLT